MDPKEEELERKHFERIINAFKSYEKHSLRRIQVLEKSYARLPAFHQRLLEHFPNENIPLLKTCIKHNSEIIKHIIRETDHIFQDKETSFVKDGDAPLASEFDMDKLKSTLKQFVRDWSSEGKAERDACYGPVLEEIEKCFPKDKIDPSKVNVLVPGAGLGRLAYDIVCRGYNCQGNEVSLFMLFASNFILNRCHSINMYKMYPWVHQHCNNLRFADQIRPITFPDVNPTDVPMNVQFSMAAGDFLEVYTSPESWDCVATVFFIDTAHNILEYVEAIYNILVPGGYWINLGPLLYHFADMPHEDSIELSYDELRTVIKKFNFEIIREESDILASYTENPRSMLKYSYNCVKFVARKPLLDENNGSAFDSDSPSDKSPDDLSQDSTMYTDS